VILRSRVWKIRYWFWKGWYQACSDGFGQTTGRKNVWKPILPVLQYPKLDGTLLIGKLSFRFFFFAKPL
jgi:hypothetical protein